MNIGGLILICIVISGGLLALLIYVLYLHCLYGPVVTVESQLKYVAHYLGPHASGIHHRYYTGVVFLELPFVLILRSEGSTYWIWASHIHSIHPAAELSNLAALEAGSALSLGTMREETPLVRPRSKYFSRQVTLCLHWGGCVMHMLLHRYKHSHKVLSRTIRSVWED
jgi:hypothetical protein